MAPWTDTRIAANGRSVQDNFLAWFRKSKLVTKTGAPLVLFHGTALEGYTASTDIEAFDPEKTGDRFSADKKGFFFTNDSRLSNFYASSDFDYRNPGSGEGAVYPVFIRAEKPLVIDDVFLSRNGMAAIGENDCAVSFWDTYQALIMEDWFDRRKHDAIVLVDNSELVRGEPVKMVVAFQPNQIKSALGNSGLYLRHSASLADAEGLDAALSLDRARSAIESIPKRRRSSTAGALP